MIISASRRTDIPTYYSEWFFKRLKERYVLVRNPMNIHQVSKIDLSPDVVDGIVFWTKNPAPMLDKLYELKDYTYYFQFTLNSYGQDVEPNVPPKKNFVIPVFKKLSDQIGAQRVIWRYDPIFISKHYTIDYHVDYFEKLAKMLKDYTYKCTISFIDLYRNTAKNLKGLELEELTVFKKRTLAKELSKIAYSYGLQIDTCAEDIELKEFNIGHARCIDDKLIEEISGYRLDVKKDKNQRLECGCVASIDIGMYNTCQNGCKYCYANYSKKTVIANFEKHDENSKLLIGQVTDKDVVKERVVKSCRDRQLVLFE